jgi:hypothetical protein
VHFDWTVSIATICAVLGLIGAAAGFAYNLVRRICARLDAIDDRGVLLDQRVAAHAAETGRRFDEMQRDVREVRSWLLNGLGIARPPAS